MKDYKLYEQPDAAFCKELGLDPQNTTPPVITDFITVECAFNNGRKETLTIEEYAAYGGYVPALLSVGPEIGISTSMALGDSFSSVDVVLDADGYDLSLSHYQEARATIKAQLAQDLADKHMPSMAGNALVVVTMFDMIESVTQRVTAAELDAIYPVVSSYCLDLIAQASHSE